jgi:cardiolipin synthase
LSLWIWNWILFGAIVVYYIQFVVTISFHRRRPEVIVAWIVIIMAVPVLGIVAYHFLSPVYNNADADRVRMKERKEIRKAQRKAQRKLERKRRDWEVAEELGERPQGEAEFDVGDGSAPGEGDGVHLPWNGVDLEVQEWWQRAGIDVRDKEVQAKVEREVFAYTQGEWMKHLALLMSAPVTMHNHVRVLSSAQAKFDVLLPALRAARHHIHMEYYRIRHDKIGQEVQEILMERAQAGVEVRLIYDGFGSFHLDKEYIAKLKQAGVQLHAFLPMREALAKKRINYRDHRKIVVIDGLHGFLGGINIGDEYFHDPRMGEWRDTHLALEGDSVAVLQKMFLRTWKHVAGEWMLSLAEYYPPHAVQERSPVQIVGSGPDHDWDEQGTPAFGIASGTVAAVAKARRRVWITTPYFIPDAALLTLLRSSAQSGMDVRLVVPDVADNNFVMHCTLSYVMDLIGYGVKVYRFSPGFVHAKVVIVDDMLATVGTANMDQRSFYSNFEATAFLYDADVIARLARDFEQDMARSHLVTEQEVRERPLGQKLWEEFARLMSPLL